MILYANLPKIIAKLKSSLYVLGVGGWCNPFNLATHVIDIMPYESRHQDNAIDPQNPENFTHETWVRHDACAAPWPFPDKFFDFSFCSIVLEDVRDPLTVCSELIRVSKSGYIETPSRQREIFAKSRFFSVRTFLGRMPEIGFAHHRWFVSMENNHVKFTIKDQHLLTSRRKFITRFQLGRKMTEDESGIGMFWDDRFSYEETLPFTSQEFAAFRHKTFRELAG